MPAIPAPLEGRARRIGVMTSGNKLILRLCGHTDHEIYIGGDAPGMNGYVKFKVFLQPRKS